MLDAFRALSIRARLYAGFGIVLLLLIATGATALYISDTFRSERAYAQAHILTPLESVSHMANAFGQMQTYAARAVQNDDPATFSDNIDRVGELQAELVAHEAAFRSSLTSADVIAAYDAWAQSRSAYEREIETAADLAMAGDVEGVRQAVATTVYASAQEVTDGIAGLREQVLAYGASATALNDQRQTRLRWMLVLLVGVSVALAIALAAHVARRVGKGLEDLETKSDRLVAGDHTAAFDTQRRDEIGALGRTLHRMGGRLVKRQVAIEGILSVSKAVNQERDLEKGLHTALEAARTIASSRFAALKLANATEPGSFVQVGLGEPDERTIADQALYSHLQRRTSAEAPAPDGVLPFMAMPVRVNDREVGVLYLGQRHVGEGAFSQDDRDIVSALAAVLAVTVDSYQAGAARRSVRKQLEESVSVILDAMSAFADGDLSVQLDESSVSDSSMSELPRLYAGFNRTVSGVGTAIREVSDSVDALAAASVEMSATVEQIAASTDHQSHQAQDVTHAMGEMVDTINANASVSMQAAEAASANGQYAQDGGAIVHQTVEKVREVARVSSETAQTVARLGASSRDIGAIAATIAEIAEQTNLLALNATIEAARAGESGRGFAVVADEVRKLAERTSNATRTIEETIATIQTDTDTAVDAIERSRSEVELGVSLAEQAGQALERIVEGTHAARDRMMQIAAATEEQSVTSATVAQSIDAITMAASEAAHGTQDVAHATNELSRLAVSLQGTVRRFRFEAPPAASGDGYAADRGAVALPGGAQPSYGGIAAV